MDVGTWTDHGSTGVKSDSSKPYNAIDPNLVNVGGTYYLTWGSFWKDIYQAQMKSSPLTLASGVSSYQLAYDPATTAVEGAFVFHYGSYYYLFFSHGSCCGYDAGLPAKGNEYKIKVCRSSSATGSFVDKSGVACTNGGGTIVLETHGNVYGPGGQGVYNDPTHGPVCNSLVCELAAILIDASFCRSFTTIMSTLLLVMLIAISGSAGILSTSPAVGLSYNRTDRRVDKIKCQLCRDAVPFACTILTSNIPHFISLPKVNGNRKRGTQFVVHVE